MEVIMTREQAKQKLISFGVAEPTDEQISDLLNSINAETKKEKDRVGGIETFSRSQGRADYKSVKSEQFRSSKRKKQGRKRQGRTCKA